MVTHGDVEVTLQTILSRERLAYPPKQDLGLGTKQELNIFVARPNPKYR